MSAPGGSRGRKKEVVHCLGRVYKLPFWHRAGIRTLFSYMSELEQQAQVDAIGWLTGSKLFPRELTSTSAQLQLSLPSSLPLALPGNILTATAQCQVHLGLFHVYCTTQQPLETRLQAAGGEAAHTAWGPSRSSRHLVKTESKTRPATLQLRQDHKQGWSTAWESRQQLRTAGDKQHL